MTVRGSLVVANGTFAFAFALAGCRGESRAPPAALVSVPVTIDGVPGAALAVGGEGLVLWTLCDRLSAAVIELRAATGAIVVGECAHRGEYTLRARAVRGRVGVELRRSTTDAPVASAAQVVGVEITSVAAMEEAARPPPPVRLVIDGQPRDVPAVELDDDAAGSRRSGPRLQAVLQAAQLQPAQLASFVIHATDGDYPIDLAWFSSTRDDMRMRYNRRGELRFEHLRDGVQVARRKVSSLEVTLAKPPPR